jgi:DNA-directed RNA polymerase subunit RPC12/RpoP
MRAKGRDVLVQSGKYPKIDPSPQCERCGGLLKLSKRLYGFMRLRGIYCPHCEPHLEGK